MMNSSKLVNNEAQSSSSTDKATVEKIIELIRRLNLKVIAFDFDCTLVTIHTSGQWIDSATKLAEFVRPCFRELIPELLLRCADVHVCVVTFSPQEKLIGDVLKVSMKNDHKNMESLINKILIKGNTKLFLEQHGIEACYSNGKQLHLAHCRSYFENVAASKPGIFGSAWKINDSSILLVDDDPQNVKLAADSGHLAFQVESDAQLSDLFSYLAVQQTTH